MVRKLDEDLKLDYCADSLMEIKRICNDLRKIYLGTRDIERINRFEAEVDIDIAKSVQQDLMAAKGYIEKAFDLVDTVFSDAQEYFDEV